MEKIKQFMESKQGKNILVILIVILTGLASFELGRLSKSDSSSGIKIEYPPEMANVISAANSPTATKATKTILPTLPLNTTTEKNFFASNRGNKYYPVGCGAGNTIKQENRIYFATSDLAEAAGYELSSSCK